MPRKQKQKQRQTQNVKQTVTIQLGEKGYKGKRRKRRQPRQPRQPREGVISLQQSLPPNVIYQSSYSIPYPVFKEPSKVETINPTPAEKPFMADVGVGTEGLVEVLDVPTKKEQQEGFITPVTSQLDTFARDERIREKMKNYWQNYEPPRTSTEENKKFINKLEKAKGYFGSLKEPLTQWEPAFTEPPISEDVKSRSEFVNKLEKTKSYFGSLKEPLTQWEPAFTQPPISEDIKSRSEFINKLEKAKSYFGSLKEPLTQSEPPISEDIKSRSEFVNKLEKTKSYFGSLKEPLTQREPPITEEVIPLSETRKRRNKQEMSEAMQMEREDIQSINLGLSQFNQPFTPAPFAAVEPMSQERQQAAIQAQEVAFEKSAEMPILEKKPRKPLTEEQKRKKAEYAKKYREMKRPI